MTTVLKESALAHLEALGQSFWLDYIDRRVIRDGQLRRMIEEDGLRGVTSNPSIFEKAITTREDYDADIKRLVRAGKTAPDICESLMVEDIRDAADVFRPLYERLDGRDGFVSLEVSPRLARDTQGTIDEARRLWKLVNRPNVMIKIPATEEGLPAIRQCVSEGVNINVTLLFGLTRYMKVAGAYIEGIERLANEGRPIGRVASVASFFLSRIDTLLDPVLERIGLGGPGAETARELHGQIAVACAKEAYQMFREVFGGRKFASLTACGARPQRLLWASTSTKNPAYSDTKYVEPLIGPDTVNTMPLELVEAYRDHGSPARRLDEGVEQANSLLARLSDIGIVLPDVADTLETEGIDKFNKAYDGLLASLVKKGARG